MQRKFLLILGLLLFPFISTAHAETTQNDESVLTLEWIDLIPESERAQLDSFGMPMVDHNSMDKPQQSTINLTRAAS